jgi:hypothetical protein
MYPLISKAATHMQTYAEDLYKVSYRIRWEVDSEGMLVCSSSRKVSFRESPILEASYCVHPFYLDEICNLLLRKKLIEAITLLFHGTIYSGDVMKEFSLFKAKSKQELKDPGCLEYARNLTGLEWWTVWGYCLPLLSKVACRLLSMHQGNGPAERDWSSRGMIKSKLRNRLSGNKHDKAHHVRQWLKEKVQKLKPQTGCRYGKPDLSGQESSSDGVGSKFPGAPEDFFWRTCVGEADAKTIEVELALDSDEDLTDEESETQGRCDSEEEFSSDADEGWEP